MKYLELNELAKAISIKAGCSIENAIRFLSTQELYLDMIGVNTVSDDESFVTEKVVIDDAEMMNFIIERTGMSESFARRLADSEWEYMSEQGIINSKGEFEPFTKKGLTYNQPAPG